MKYEFKFEYVDITSSYISSILYQARLSQLLHGHPMFAECDAHECGQKPLK